MAATENHNSVITLATFLKTLDAEVDAYLEGKRPDFDFQWEAFNRQREKLEEETYQKAKDDFYTMWKTLR